MKKLFTLFLVLFIAGTAFGQLTDIAHHSPIGFAPSDSNMAYFYDQGARGCWIAEHDLDGDGLQEILATDYSNGGRVHVWEMTSPGVIEIVWSSPVVMRDHSSVPRWVRTGDLDGDGVYEIIFPTGKRNDGAIEVWENDGDNSYGTQPALTLPHDQFQTTIGTDLFRMDRETGLVEDIDGDGKSELIVANEDQKVYIIGVIGTFPGFATWQIEGGDPNVHPENRFSGGSWWHSFTCDYNGDGVREIVNLYWNYLGFWSIIPDGADTYIYPTPTAHARNDHYYEYMADSSVDGTHYMGAVVFDADGDGNEEICGSIYVSNSSDWNYKISLLNLNPDDEGVYVFDNDPKQWDVIGDNLWNIAGNTVGSHWGVSAYDFNDNGRDELLIGGSAGYNVIGYEYKGTGELLDSTNWEASIYFEGAEGQFFTVNYYDSLGVPVDTTYGESPFVSRIFAGADLDNDGNKEAIAVYQSVADSITYSYYSWDPDNSSFMKDSSAKVGSDKGVNLRVLEYGITGFREVNLTQVTPDDYVLEQNYPNPFNPSTNVRFSIPVEKKISVVVYDMLGKEVRTLIDGETVAKGSYEVEWNGTNNFNQPVASGTYITTLKWGNFSKSIKMQLLK